MSGARAISAVIPIAAGYFPVAFAYGALAVSAGIGIFPTVLMSLIVYAGASQFIAIGMIAAGASPTAIGITTFVVNFRHLLMTLALSPFLARWPGVSRALFAAQVTDETFAVHSARWAEAGAVPDRAGAFTINVLAQVAWVAGTVTGALVGSGSGDPRKIGLDFALTGMFVALLVLQARSLRLVTVGLASAAFWYLFSRLGAGHWSIILAALAGSGLSMARAQWRTS